MENWQKGRVPKRIWLGRVVFTAGLVWTFWFIFGNSAVTAEQSSLTSGRVLQFLRQLLQSVGLPRYAAMLNDHIVRKLAHFCEYALLGFLALCDLRVYVVRWGRQLGWLLFALLATALADETSQLFYEGRSGQVTDVWLDFSGACCGVLTAVILWALCALLLAYLAEKRKRKTR